MDKYTGVIVFLIFLLAGLPATASNLVIEYTSDFDLAEALYSAKLAVADFDGDGRDDIVISDDYGSFHIFALHDGVFEELWVSDPLEGESCPIKWLGMIEGKERKSRIFVLDTLGMLHRFSYDGYVLGRTGSWAIPSEGYIVDAAVVWRETAGSPEFVKLAILPEDRFVVSTYLLNEETSLTRPAVGIDAPLAGIPGIAVDDSGQNAVIITLSENQSAGSSGTYILELNTSDGTKLSGVEMRGFDPEEESIALTALDDGGDVIILGFGISEQFSHLKMRMWHKDQDTMKPGPWTDIIAHRDIAAGDIDGDGRQEFVLVGIDSKVRVLDEERISYSLDGKSILPDRASIVDQGEIFQDAGFFKKLGITITGNHEELIFKIGIKEVTFTGGPDEWSPESGDGPTFATITDAYGVRLFPTSRVCIALGFAFRYRSDQGLVEVYS